MPSKAAIFVSLLCSLAAARAYSIVTRSSTIALANGEEAQSLNAMFATLSGDQSCDEGDRACVNGEVGTCLNGAFSLTSCGSGTSCFAVPLVNTPGTKIVCDSEEDAAQRIAATGATGGLTG